MQLVPHLFQIKPYIKFHDHLDCSLCNQSYQIFLLLLHAAILLKLKVRWLREEERKEAVRKLLAAKCCPVPSDADTTVRAQKPATSEEDFFAFDEEENAASFNSDTEVIEYLKSGSEMEVLNYFLRIKSMFLKLNTGMTSSAPAERPLRRGSLVFTPRRNQLSDAV